MRSAKPHPKPSRCAASFALSLALFLNLLPLRSLAATPSTAQPANNKSTEHRQQEDTQDGGAPLPQEKSPPAERKSQDKRSPLAKSPILIEFKEWVEQFKLGGTIAASEQRGLELAERRRSVMAKLVESDPESAVESSVPAYIRQRMPDEIRQQVEEQISGYGDYLVRVYDYVDPSTGEFTHARIERKVVIGGKTYDASVYGSKLGMTTKLNIPLRGVAVNGVIALAESPVRVLEPEEKDGFIWGQGVDAEVGGKVLHFESQEQLDSFEEKLKKREMTIGPDGAGDAAKDMTAEAVMSDNSDVPTKSTWTEGAKTVLFMRVDFSDKPGEPVDHNGEVLTLSRAQNLLNNECANFYKTNSYNKTSVSGTVTPVLRLPQTASWYGTNNNPFQLLDDARVAAKAAGFNTDNYNLDIVTFTRIEDFGWAGLGFIGGKGSWLNGYFTIRESSHELGHNYGLNHANLWKTTNGTVIGAGTSEEYANPFDSMGGGQTISTHHFGAWFKNLLNWLPNTDVLNVGASGTYRIQAYDFINSTGRRALKVQKDAGTFYWVEFRQAITEYPAVQNGAVIYWGYTQNEKSNLLDMTPNSVDGAKDSPLAIGKTFTDTVNGIKITAVSKSTATSPASLDVNVTFTTNLATLALNPTTVVGGNTVTGTVTLNAPAPTMGATVNLSDNLAATTVPDSVFIHSGMKTATFTITTKAVAANQSGTVTASYRGVSKTSPLTVQPLALSSLTLNKSAIGGGGTVTGTVTLNSAAPAAGAVVNLSDDIAAANTPSSVTIPAGAKTKTFSITTSSVTANQSGNVTASYGGVTKTAPLSVVPIALSLFSLHPVSVAGGVNVTGTLTLNGPAPAGGAQVAVSDNIPATTLPASVTVPAGATQKTFTITSVVVSAKQSGTVSATYGTVTKTKALTITPPALSSLTLLPSSVAGGNNVAVTVSLDGPAPSSGATITLSDNLASANTPASVNIPAGAKSANFTITTVVVNSKQTGAVTASRDGVTKTAALTVRPVSVQSITVNPNPITGGNSATGTIVLERTSPSSTVVTLSDNLPATTIPPSVTVPANTLSQTFQITTTYALPSQTGVLSATANGETRTLSLKVVNTQAQLLANPGFESGRVSWAVSSGSINKIISQSLDGQAKSGEWFANFGGWDFPVTESLYQDVMIPASATSATLSFYLWLPTQEGAATANDKLEVQLQDGNGAVLATIATYSNLDNNSAYVKKTLNLLPYKGQTVRLFFLCTTNQGGNTWFFVDEVMLDVIY